MKAPTDNSEAATINCSQPPVQCDGGQGQAASSSSFTIDNPLLSLPISISVDEQQEALQGLRLPESIGAYVNAALSFNTRVAYRSDLADFLKWGGCVPASAEMLATYAADRAATLSPHTIARRIVGVSRAHTSQGYSDPAKSDLVKMVLRGIRRQHGKPQRQALPLVKQDLLAMLSFMQGTKGLRDRALIMLGFAAALRRSEITSLDVEDLALSSEGILITLQRSKTDQVGEGRKIAIPYGRTSACPVTAVVAWLSHANVEAGALFRSVDKSGAIGTRLSAQSVALILKSYAGKIGLSTSAVSGHSLRAGFVTSAAQAGAAIHKIQLQTGHRSLAMLSRYIRDGRLFVDNACASVL